tara:strand:- start:35417 stop:36448 length:1032 start_codon:yes stop_codon:yes gene_type:complete
MVDPIVALSLDSQDWYGWQEIKIQSAITQVSSEFTLKLTDKWSDTQSPRPIKKGAACSVSINDVTVVTGYIDDVNTSYDAQSHSIEVAGRDATGDIVDCSAPSFQWIGRSLLKGAQALCKPFGVAVVATTDVSKAFERMKSDEGETVFEVLEQAARVRGVLLMADGLGGLIIGRAGNQRLSGRFELGVNIEQGSGRQSMRDRFSEYTVKGQSSDPFGGDSSVMAKAKDSAVKRHRPKVILAEDGLDLAGCKTRAIWHRNIAAAKGNEVNYVVNAWHLDGQLIQPNYLVHVSDPFLKVSGEMLIVSRTFILDDKGLRTEVTLSDPKAYELEELPEPGDDEALFS